MNRVTLRTGLAVALTAAAIALPAQAQSPRPPAIWRQAMIAPKADAGFFLMAARRGFAEREGLKIEVTNVKDDGVGVRALLSGEVDSFDSATGGVTVTAKGADAKMVGCSWLAAPYVVLARPGITSMDALRGKTIAASAPGSPPELAFERGAFLHHALGALAVVPQVGIFGKLIELGQAGARLVDIKDASSAARPTA